tara:strand:+ start:931 stop:1194 length:264 start_codon:yes stop_codon:yes gene_type:complete
MIRNCAPHPVAIGFGVLSTRLKSLKVRVIPIPSIITAKPGVINGRNHVNQSCSNRAKPLHIITQTGKRFAKVFRIRVIILGFQGEVS